MNFKKLFLVLILFSGFYACECFRETAWDITSFDVLIVDKYDNPPSDGVIEGDSVKLTIIFKAEFVESINPLKGFLNSAYATSCSPLGGKGLIDEVVKLLVTSNSDFEVV